MEPVKDRIATILHEVKHIGLFLVAVVTLACVVFFHLSVRNQVIQLGYTLNKENLKGRQLVRQRSELELEKAIMKNPDEVGKQAQERFDMHIPSKEQLVNVRKGKGR